MRKKELANDGMSWAASRSILFSDMGNNISAPGFFGLKQDLIPGFDLFQHCRVFDLEHHGHCRHAEIYYRAVTQRDFFCFPVNPAHFAIRHRDGVCGAGDGLVIAGDGLSAGEGKHRNGSDSQCRNEYAVVGHVIYPQ